MVSGLLVSGCWVVSQWLLGCYLVVAGLFSQWLLGCWSVVAGLLVRWPIYLRKFRIVDTMVSETRPTQISMMIYIHYNRVTFDP